MRNIKGMDVTEKMVCIVEGYLTEKDGIIHIEKIKLYERINEKEE